MVGKCLWSPEGVLIFLLPIPGLEILTSLLGPSLLMTGIIYPENCPLTNTVCIKTPSFRLSQFYGHFSKRWPSLLESTIGYTFSVIDSVLFEERVEFSSSAFPGLGTVTLGHNRWLNTVDE